MSNQIKFRSSLFISVAALSLLFANCPPASAMSLGAFHPGGGMLGGGVPAGLPMSHMGGGTPMVGGGGLPIMHSMGPMQGVPTQALSHMPSSGQIMHSEVHAIPHEAVKAPVTLGSSTYHGVTTSVARNADGTHTVTTTDRNGKTTSKVTGNEPVTKPVGGNGPFGPPNSGSSTYNGVTTTVTKNADGTHTVTTTDASGNTSSKVTGNEPVSKPVGGNGPFGAPNSGSSTYNGVTTTVTKNADGTHTVTTTDASGNTSSKVTGNEPVTKPVGGNGPFGPPNSGSSTYNGVTTTVTKNADGSHTITRTDRDGRTIERHDRDTWDHDRHYDDDDDLGWLWAPVVPPVVVDQAPVSYGSTPQTGLVRVDDLPQVAKKVKNDCALLRAKVNRLMNKLAHQLAVLSTLQGVQNVDLSGTVTGTATSFNSAADQQAAIERMQSDIADTQELLARYQADLDKCEKNN